MTGDGQPTWWEQTWFRPGSALALQLVRVLVFTTILVDLWRSHAQFRQLPDRAEAIWDPISILGLLPVEAPTEPLVSGVLIVTAVASLLAMIPRVGRVPAIAAAAGYGYLILASNSLGKIDHNRQPLVVMAIVMALSAAPRLTAEPSWRYRWPVQASRLAMAAMLFAAAYSKVWTGGWDWVFSEHLRNMLVAEVELHRDPALAPVSLWIASHPVLWQGAAALTIIGEGALIGSLFVRNVWIGRTLVVAGAGVIVGITLLMGLIGFPILVLCAVFIDGDRLIDAWHRQVAWWRPLLIPMSGCASLVIVRAVYGPIDRVVYPIFAIAAVMLFAALSPRTWHPVPIDQDGRSEEPSSRSATGGPRTSRSRNAWRAAPDDDNARLSS